MTLYHYTCDDGHAQIDGVLLARPVVWLTDLDVPIRDALGLTSHSLNCDRTGHRYRVTDESTCVRWIDVVRVGAAPRSLIDQLHAQPGVRPMHWWVSASPVPVIYDPVSGEVDR